MLNRCEFTVINGMNTEDIPCGDIATTEFFPNPNNFNCYTISVNQSSIDNSLLISDISVILYSQTEKEKLMQWALGLEPIGFKVILHETGTSVDPTQEGFVMQTGQNAQVKVSLNIHEKLEPPYGKCIRDTSDIYIRTLDGRRKRYSQHACKRATMQSILKKRYAYIYYQTVKGTTRARQSILCRAIKILKKRNVIICPSLSKAYRNWFKVLLG